MKVGEKEVLKNAIEALAVCQKDLSEIKLDAKNKQAAKAIAQEENKEKIKEEKQKEELLGAIEKMKVVHKELGYETEPPTESAETESPAAEAEGGSSSRPNGTMNG